MTKMIDLKLCAYISDYIQEEFSRGVSKSEIDKYLISMAIEAYNNGEIIGENNEE
jgi:hypothetical protein